MDGGEAGASCEGPRPGCRVTAVGGHPAQVLRVVLVNQCSTPIGPRSGYELEDGVFM